jgi:hypothetical protein
MTTITRTFDGEDFEIEKLKAVLNKAGLSFDSVAHINDGDFEEFTHEFSLALSDLECSGEYSFSPGRMYMSNGDPGYPDESSFDDFSIEEVSILGKKIDITDCLTSKVLAKLEEEICEKASEYCGPDEQEYEND